MHNYFYNRGFSLIEVLIYLALLVLLSSVVVGIVLSLSNTFYNIRANRALETGAIATLERMALEIRNADSILLSGSILNTSPGELEVIQNIDETSQNIRFYVDEGNVNVSIDGGEGSTLFPSAVSVDSLIFRRVVNGVSEGVRIELSLQSVVGRISLTKLFTDFVILRGSYGN